MTLKYNVTGSERKKLVQAIAQIHGCASRYLAAPTFAYQVGAFHISRDGTVSIDGEDHGKELAGLAAALLEHGFTPEEMPPLAQEGAPLEAVEAVQESVETPQEATQTPVTAIPTTEALTVGEAEEAPKMAAQAATGGFCVEIPRAGVTQAALDNLRKLLDSKAALIRKALGARTGSILLQFLAESVIITLLGGLIGILIGVAGAAIVCGAIGFRVSINLATVLGASLFSSAVGIFFGIYPARKAAKLSPIEALRHE